MKSWRKPTSEAVDRAVALLSRRAYYQHFFDVLPNPRWVEPLHEKGFFTKPPPVDQAASGEVIFPRWPESRYLARMAPHAPQIVADVLTGIQHTDNIEVQEDIATALLAMPADLSAKFIEAIKRWIQSTYFGLPQLPLKLGKLLSHLARGGEVDASLDLARHLLQVTARETNTGASDHSSEFDLPPEPEARFGTWEYEEILKRNIPDLVEAAGTKAVGVLCDLLEEGVLLLRGKQKERAPLDFSFIWRPAVEDHPQNRAHTILDALISAVRDGTAKVAKDHPELIADLVSMLESRPWNLFQRLSLWLLALFRDSASNLVAERIASEDLFDNYHVRHEYFHLSRAGFRHFSSEQKAEFFERIRNGPDTARIRRWIESDGSPATDYRMDHLVRLWRRDQLAPVKDYLPEEWSREYEQLVSELGEAEHPDFPCWYESGTGPNSPLSPKALAAMEIDEIVTFMMTWHPTHERRISASQEGLGRAFSTVVESDPVRFASSASKFTCVDPTYVRSLLSGLERAVRAGMSIDWTGVIDLCQWVVAQPRTVPPREARYDDRDPHWGWARGQVADLLEAGLASAASPISTTLRQDVWKVLEPLSNDPDPTTDEESLLADLERDPLMDSWNTTRAKAIRTVINYAVRVKEDLNPPDQPSVGTGYGLETMPEVEKVLDQHLDVQRDPSLAIRSVYGQWLPDLVWLDRSWVQKKLGMMFPQEPQQTAYWQVAWESYVKVCRVRRPVFDLIRSEYERAIASVGQSEKEHYFGEDPDDALAVHLMTVYWHGGEDIDRDSSLIREFFVKAPPKLRAHAFYLLGESLHRHPGELASDLSDRLTKLWEWRLNSYSSSEGETALEHCELAPFGWWFTSGKFDPGWSLEQLKATIPVCGRTETCEKVVERLTELAGEFPFPVAECLLLLVEKTKETWQLHYWRDAAYAALEAVCQVGDDEAIRLVRKAANRFGERGFRSFKALCPRISA